MATTALLPAKPVSVDALPACERDSLLAWFNLYMGLEAGANADNTIAAKTRDLEAFLGFFSRAIGSDQPTSRTFVSLAPSVRSTPSD